MKCKWCGKEVPPGRKIYCSYECYKKGNNKETNQQYVKGTKKAIVFRSKDDKNIELDKKVKEAREMGLSYGKMQALKFMERGLI